MSLENQTAPDPSAGHLNQALTLTKRKSVEKHGNKTHEHRLPTACLTKQGQQKGNKSLASNMTGEISSAGSQAPFLFI